MSIETQVREAIERHTTGSPPPVPDTAALLVRGRRRRHARVAGTAVSAICVSVVVAVAAVSAIGPRWTAGRGDVPVTTGGAEGPAAVTGPTEVFHTRDSVWVDGRRHPAGQLTWDTGAHVSSLGLVFPAEGTGVPYFLDRNGRQHQLAPDTPVLGGASYDRWVAADSTGTLVSWAEITNDGAEVVAFDLATMREVARKRLPCDVDGTVSGCPRPYVVSDGVVFVHRADGTWAWRPGAGGQRSWVRLGDGFVAQAHSKTIGLFPGGTIDLELLGAGWRVLSGVAGEPLLSFDGRYVVDANGAAVVEWQHPQRRVTYHPPGAPVESQFDTDGSVLFVTESDGLYRVYDCTAQRRCEPVSEPMRQEIRLIAWDL